MKKDTRNRHDDLKALARSTGYLLDLVGIRHGVIRRRQWLFFNESDQSLRERIAWKWFDESKDQ